MTKIDKKQMDGIVAIINKMQKKQRSMQNKRFGNYEFNMVKENGTLEINVCKIGKRYEDVGFAKKSVNSDISTPKIYTTINEIVRKATYDGITVCDWR